MTNIVHFMRRPRKDSFSIERLHEDLRGALPSDCRVTVWTCRNFSMGVWWRLQDIWLARRQQGDVNHVTGDVHYLTYLLDPRKTVLTVHDLVMLGRLRGLKRWILWFLWYWIPVRTSRAVVVVSESTRRQLLISVSCDPAKISVIHNNVSDEFRPKLRQFNAGCPRILQIGTGPNKNLERVVEALQFFPCKLVIVGALSSAQVAALLLHKIDYENHVGISREALVAQYVASDLLIFASTYEGFGLPILEANATGRPVITSNLLSMPEVAGEAACLVDPFDVASIRGGLRRVIEDEAYRVRLVEAGFANAAKFQTPIIAEQYAALYREIAKANTVPLDATVDLDRGEY